VLQKVAHRKMGTDWRVRLPIAETERTYVGIKPCRSRKKYVGEKYDIIYMTIILDFVNRLLFPPSLSLTTTFRKLDLFPSLVVRKKVFF
jgi:hypothetical protein